MGCDSFIYTANQDVTVDAGGLVPLGTAVHYQCRDCELEGSGIVCRGRGAFIVDATATMSQTDTSSALPPVLSIALLRNGDDVQGATAAANSDGTVTLNVHAVVRNDTCASSTLALRNSGPEALFRNVSAIVKKVG